MSEAKRRIVVGLSGGVDSAVAAYLLKKEGHEVHALFMKNWEDDDNDTYCSSNEDFVDAVAVADVLGIEIEHVNFAADYKDRVFAEFLKKKNKRGALSAKRISETDNYFANPKVIEAFVRVLEKG